MKKITKIFGFISLAVIILLFLLTWWTKGKIDRGEMVKLNGKWMTQQDFHKIVPPQVYKVESKNKPEDVYTAFRQALLSNDLEKALVLMTVEKRETYRKAFGDKAKLDAWVVKLPEKITQESVYENIMSYYYLNNTNKDDKIAHPIEFIKNKDGYWQIDQI